MIYYFSGMMYADSWVEEKSLNVFLLSVTVGCQKHDRWVISEQGKAPSIWPTWGALGRSRSSESALLKDKTATLVSMDRMQV